MSKKAKALGKGVAALFSTEQHELVDKSSNSEVISDNAGERGSDLEVISDNVEDKSSNSELHNKEDLSSDLKDKTKISEVKSTNLDEITYNLEVMKEALADAKQNPRISLWSPRSATLLRYLRKTKPEFSISEEAGLLLEDAIMRKYPELSKQVDEALAKK
jgi:hypothetical protein